MTKVKEQEPMSVDELETAAAALVPSTSDEALATRTVEQKMNDMRKLYARTIGKDLNADELDMLFNEAARTGLDPMQREIYMRKYRNRQGGHDVSIQIGIDGYRKVAARTGKYQGQLGPMWCGADGEWHDAWVPKEFEPYPVAAKVAILHKEFIEPLWNTAHFLEYADTVGDGEDEHPVGMWAKMPANQLAKCAESLAIRRAFPDKLAGTHTAEEMGRANREHDVVEVEAVEVEEPKQIAADKPKTKAEAQLDARVKESKARSKAEKLEADLDAKLNEEPVGTEVFTEPMPIWGNGTVSESTATEREGFAEACKALGLGKRQQMLDLLGYASMEDIPDGMTYWEIYSAARAKLAEERN